MAIHASKYFETIGYDINPKAVEKARQNGINATNNWEQTVSADVYVLAVSTGIIADGKPDMSAIENVCGKLKDSNALVCIESTITVGTSRRMALQNNLKYLVHCPHRFWDGDPINHGVVQLRVLGALNEESFKKGKAFYDSLGIPVHVVSSLETAEATKIAENAYRFVQIAFSEELKMICVENNLDFDEIRTACNTKWNVDLLEARDGIGKHCLPKDIRYLLDMAKTAPLLNGAIETDKKYKAALKRCFSRG